MNALHPDQFSKKKDYLNCHERLQIVKFLKANHEDRFGGECLSDFIFLYDKKLRKKRMCILITHKHIYVYNYHSWKVVFMNELNNLTAMSIAARNCTLLSIHFASGPDIMLESYRRIEIILYCAQMMKEVGLDLFKLKIRKHFRQSSSVQQGPGEKTDDDAPLKDVPVKTIEKAKKQMEVGFLQETIRNSKKSGFMRLLKKGFFGGNTFTEYFFILSDIGMVYFKKYGEKKAEGFIPILGGTTKQYPRSMYSKDFVFSIRFAEEETVLQAASKVEEEDWIKLIASMQEKCLTAKDTIKEIGKVL